jgi:hypothetical protein
MGEQAKKRFQDLAAKFKKNLNQNQNNHNIQNGGSFGTGGGASERRGLLDIHDDDDEQEISFVGGAAGGAEMRNMDTGFAFNKKIDWFIWRHVLVGLDFQMRFRESFRLSNSISHLEL